MPTQFEKQIDAEMENGPRLTPFEAEIDHDMALEEHGTVPQQVLTGIEKGAQGFAGPAATAAEEALHRAGVPGISPEDRRLREEANPATSLLSEMGGFGAGIATGTGLPSVLSKTAHVLTPVVSSLPIVNKLGSKAVNAMIDMAAFQGQSEVTKYINQEPGQTVGNALTHTGLSAALGGGLSLAGSAFWKSTVGKRVSQSLGTIADHYGGIEGVAPTAMDEVIAKTGMELDPIIQGGLSEDRAISDLFHTLNQTDSSRAGLEVQKTAKEFHEQAAKVLSESLGKTVEQIPERFDNYAAGNRIGKTLAQESEAAIDPVVKEYEKIKEEFGDTPLIPDKFERVQTPETLKNPYATATFTQVKTPGVVSEATDKIMALAQKEGWVASPSSESMALANRVIKELPLQKTVNDLGNLIKSVNAEIEKNPANGTFNRSASLIADSLRNSEGFALELQAFDKLPAQTQTDLFRNSHKKQKAYEKAYQKAYEKIDRLQNARKGYADAAKLVDPLMERLGLEGSISGFPKRLQRMAQDDGEGILKKLSGKNDAYLLQYVSEKFPQVAQVMRESQIDELLTRSVFNGELSPYRITKAFNDLSPQSQRFLAQGNFDKIKAIDDILNKFKNPRHNFSNTARTLLNKDIKKFLPATIAATVSSLTGHGALTTGVVSYIAHEVSKEAPDAVKLAMLRWMGSNRPIDPSAFKAMTGFLSDTIKGENLIKNASKALFETGEKVIPEHLYPTHDELESLDKKLKEINLNPSKLEKVGDKTSYYMPDHGVSIVSTLSNAAMYVNSQRPVVQKDSPLDEDMEPNLSQKEDFKNVLSIAQQPLVVMDHVKEGTVTEDDMRHLTTMYPEIYKSMAYNVNNELLDQLADKKEVPYKTKFGLSVFLGQPMDSSFNEDNVSSNQQAFASHAQEQMDKEQALKPSKSQMSKIKASSRLSLNHSDSGT